MDLQRRQALPDNVIQLFHYLKCGVCKHYNHHKPGFTRGPCGSNELKDFLIFEGFASEINENPNRMQMYCEGCNWKYFEPRDLDK